jgi:hypothetical protein
MDDELKMNWKEITVFASQGTPSLLNKNQLV